MAADYAKVCFCWRASDLLPLVSRVQVKAGALKFKGSAKVESQKKHKRKAEDTGDQPPDLRHG
jgi:hypothetical protein